MTMAGMGMTCIKCGGTPDCTITIERNGVLAHYASCFDHVAQVVARIRADISGASFRPIGPTGPPTRPAEIIGPNGPAGP